MTVVNSSNVNVQDISDQLFFCQEFFDELVNQDTSAARFMKKITSKCWAFSRDFGINKKDFLFGLGFVPYDAFAVAACVDSSIITESLDCAVRVEMQGELGRGMMVLDPSNTLNKDHRVFVMRKCDLLKFSEMLKTSLHKHVSLTSV